MAIRGPHGTSDQPAMHASAPPMHAPCMHPRPHQHATSLCICRWGRQDVHRGVYEALAPQGLHAAWECLSEHWHAAACMYAYTHDIAALALHAVPKRHILEPKASVVPSRPFGAEGPVAALNPGARAPASSPASWRGAGGLPHPCTPYFIPAPPASSLHPLLHSLPYSCTPCLPPAPPASYLHPLIHSTPDIRVRLLNVNAHPSCCVHSLFSTGAAWPLLTLKVESTVC